MGRQPLVRLLVACGLCLLNRAGSQTIELQHGPAVDRRHVGWPYEAEEPLNALLNDDAAFNRGELSPLTAPPSPRANHGVASLAWRLFVFGGVDGDGYLLNDVHFYDVRASAWSGAIERPWCCGAGGADASHRDRVGGIEGGGATHDLVQEHPPPSPRSHHAMVGVVGADDGSGAGAGAVWVFGGLSHLSGYDERAFSNARYTYGVRGDAMYLNDIHAFDADKMAWSGPIQTYGRAPVARASAAIARVSRVLYIFGGEGAGGAALSDLVVFNTSTRRWIASPRAARNGPSPRSAMGLRLAGPTDARSSAAAVELSARGLVDGGMLSGTSEVGGLGERTLWLFGGKWASSSDDDRANDAAANNISLALADVWALNADTLEWTCVHTGGTGDAAGAGEGAPEARHSHATFAPSDAWLVVSGGVDGSGAPLDDIAAFRLPGDARSSATEQAVRVGQVGSLGTKSAILDWHTYPSPLNIRTRLHDADAARLSPSPFARRPPARRAFAYDSMGAPWGTGGNGEDGAEGSTNINRDDGEGELLLEFGGFLISPSPGLDDGESSHRESRADFTETLTNRLYIYQRSRVRIDDDFVDSYSLIDVVL